MTARDEVSALAEKLAPMISDAEPSPKAPAPDTAAADPATASAPAADPAASVGSAPGTPRTDAEWEVLRPQMPPEQFAGLREVAKAIPDVLDAPRIAQVLDYAQAEFGLSREEAYAQLMAVQKPKALIKYFRDAAKWAEERAAASAEPEPQPRPSDRRGRRGPAPDAEYQQAKKRLEKTGRSRDAQDALLASGRLDD